MSLTKFTENTNVISELADTPTLTSAELKAKFDEVGTKIKSYLNSTLTTETEQLVASEKTTLQGLISALGTQIRSEISEGLQARYHVGKVIMDTENVNPYSYLGFGTWELWGEGRVPVGVNLEDTDFNEAEKTGGAKTHTLTIAQIPGHTHGQQVAAATGSRTGIRNDYVGEGNSNTYAQGISTQSTGGGQAHNNLQPYITCYMWKRVS